MKTDHNQAGKDVSKRASSSQPSKASGKVRTPRQGGAGDTPAAVQIEITGPTLRAYNVTASYKGVPLKQLILEKLQEFPGQLTGRTWHMEMENATEAAVALLELLSHKLSDALMNEGMESQSVAYGCARLVKSVQARLTGACDGVRSEFEDVKSLADGEVARLVGASKRKARAAAVH